MDFYVWNAFLDSQWFFSQWDQQRPGTKVSIYSAKAHVTFCLLPCHLPLSLWELLAQVIPIEYPNYCHFFFFYILAHFRIQEKEQCGNQERLFSTLAEPACLCVKVTQAINNLLSFRWSHKCCCFSYFSFKFSTSCSPIAFVIFLIFTVSPIFFLPNSHVNIAVF